MSSAYEISMANATVVANGELITLRAATAWTSRASLLRLMRMQLTQQGTATSQQLAVRYGLKASAFGTFTGVTPAPTNLNAVASAIASSTSNAASSCGINNTGSAGAGTLTVLHQEGFNNLNGWLWVPTPDEQIYIGPDLTFLLQLQGTPTTLTGWNASLVFEELN